MRLMHPKDEMTFLMVKPDGVGRGLTGEILCRIERAGLKVVAAHMMQASRKKIDAFYPKSREWITRLGEKTLATYQKFGYDPIKELGTDQPYEIGKMVRAWLLDFMTSGPVFPVVVKGMHAVEMIRKMVGDTMPSKADVGTIRGTFSTDSAAAANRDKRAVFNIVHASETVEEATKERRYWFRDDELCEYRRSDEVAMFSV